MAGERRAMVCRAGLGRLALCVAGLCLLCGCESTEKPKPEEWVPSPGDIVTLVNDGAAMPIVTLCDDTHTYDQLVKAATAHDEVGQREIEGGGHTFITRSGTRARVLEYDLLEERVQVRLADGPLKDRAGWLPRKSVKK